MGDLFLLIFETYSILNMLSIIYQLVDAALMGLFIVPYFKI